MEFITSDCEMIISYSLQTKMYELLIMSWLYIDSAKMHQKLDVIKRAIVYDLTIS